MNNETIGISAEVAIANAFQVPINSDYVKRSNNDIVDLLEQNIIQIFKCENIPSPVKHVAEGQNPVDFILKDKTTLSVKTNKNKLNKVAPQIIGQPTSKKYFEYFDDIIDCSPPATYEEKVELFKRISITYIEIVMKHYWKNLFECDHLLFFYHIIDKNRYIHNNYKYLYIPKPVHEPIWQSQKIKFTKSFDSWGESCTVKYESTDGKYISLGEFQAHKNRDCLKFRFNMKGLLKLIDSNSI